MEICSGLLRRHTRLLRAGSNGVRTRITWSLGRCIERSHSGVSRGLRLGESSTIARVMAGFVHSVSAWHYLEHTLYSQLPVHHNPHRIRVAPPTGEEQPTEWWQRTRRTDLFRQEIARRMFYEGHTVRRLLDVDYAFDNPHLKSAAIDFKNALRTTDREQPEAYQLLENMACSIQF